MNISIVWWNTGISPPRAKLNRISSAEKKIFVELLADMIGPREIDVIGLCELTIKDVNWIRAEVAPYGYNVESGIVKAGLANFDTCILYNAKKLVFVDQDKYELPEFNRITKIGQRFIFSILGDARPLHLFALHWPSRLYMDEWNPNRLMFGKSLRVPIDRILKQYTDAHKDAFIVVMGDFNDEPYNVALTDGLYATRDRNLISKNPLLLYNPFWKRLSPQDSYSSGAQLDKKSGTYFYPSGVSTHWRTFDQIIISSAFLGLSDWHLVEAGTEIIDFPKYTDLVTGSGSKFDHLPVKIVIERIENG